MKYEVSSIQIGFVTVWRIYFYLFLGVKAAVLAVLQFFVIRFIIMFTLPDDIYEICNCVNILWIILIILLSYHACDLTLRMAMSVLSVSLSVGLTTVVWSEIFQALWDGFSWIFVQKFMVLRGWILSSMMHLLLLCRCHWRWHIRYGSETCWQLFHGLPQNLLHTVLHIQGP